MRIKRCFKANDRVLSVQVIIFLCLVLVTTLILARSERNWQTLRSIGADAVMLSVENKMISAARGQGFNYQQLLVEGAPFLAGSNSGIIELGRRNILSLGFFTLTRVDISDPKTFFTLQFPAAAMEAAKEYNPADPEQEGPILELVESEEIPVKPHGPALVGIYTSHNSESYVGDGGGLYQEGNGEIASVATEMAKTLEKLGVSSVYSAALHDYPRLDQAYSKSVRTATQLVKENPKLHTLIDVHRDGLPPNIAKRIVVIAGKPSSPVMIVLAMHHERWQENEKFAKELVQKGNEMYPGLFLPIYYAADARYNQNLHPHALLLEFGDQYSTTDEAKRSARAVAKVLQKVIKP